MDGEEVFERVVRFRTVGDMSCTGQLRIDRRHIEEIIDRGGGQPDHRARRQPGRRPHAEAAMEDRKRQGYF
jgi:sulfate adenylyltransferase subunit 2